MKLIVQLERVLKRLERIGLECRERFSLYSQKVERAEDDKSVCFDALNLVGIYQQKLKTG